MWTCMYAEAKGQQLVSSITPPLFSGTGSLTEYGDHRFGQTFNNGNPNSVLHVCSSKHLTHWAISPELVVVFGAISGMSLPLGGGEALHAVTPGWCMVGMALSPSGCHPSLFNRNSFFLHSSVTSIPSVLWLADTKEGHNSDTTVTEVADPPGLGCNWKVVSSSFPEKMN